MATDSKQRAILYLDACCLNRPFDDQTQIRIRLEAEAVLLIIFQLHLSGWEWLGSEVLSYEIDQTPDPDRRMRVKSMMSGISHRVSLEPEMVGQAEDLVQLGLKTYDALHVVSAEKGGADAVLTTDDRFIRAVRRNASKFNVKVTNPLRWLEEILL